MYKYVISIIPFIIAGSLPFIFLKEKRKAMAYTLIVSLCFGILFDFWASYLSLWAWNDSELIGRFLGLPIEDYMLAFFGTGTIIAVYEMVKKLLKGKKWLSIF